MTKVAKIVFTTLIVVITVYLMNWFRESVPTRIFFLFSALVATFIFWLLILHKILAKKFEDKPYLVKIFDLTGAIVFFISLYLLTLYVFTGTSK
jgi:uncharacterized membrane protein YtjA (UPF0391 family)